jgi:hypothetical protein
LPNSQLKYPEKSLCQPAIVNQLTAKYGADNLYWPIFWYNPTDLRIQCISFEVNTINNTNNHISTTSPILASINGIPVCKVDYTKSYYQRITILKGNEIPNYIKISSYSKYSNSLEYTCDKKALYNYYSTIDGDYFWIANGQLFGLELSTFNNSMINAKRPDYADHLVNQAIKKRFAIPNAHQLYILGSVAQILGAKMTMAFVHIDSDQKIDESDKAYSFPLDKTQADGMHNGFMPHGKTIEFFNDFLIKL